MLKKIKDKLYAFGGWCKKMWKELLITAGIVTIALAAPPIPMNEVSKAKLIEKYNASQEIQAEYQLDGASLVKNNIKNAELDKYKGEPKDEIKITIGEKDSEEFVPNIELKRWNEVSFKIKPKLEGVAKKDKNLSFEGNKIKFDTPKMSYEFYPYDEGEGGYKFIWYLNEKPDTNIIEFQFESEGLDFWYQPPFTEELNSEEWDILTDTTAIRGNLEDGSRVEKYRPENIVGSYVFFHKTKGGMVDIYSKDYKTGGGGTIYRPQFTDSNGWKIWGELFIDAEKGIYQVTIPKDFYNNAVYPIKSNDTFGFNTGSSTTFENACSYAVPATPEFSGTVSKITWKSKAYSSSYYGKAKCALYDGTDLIDNGATDEFTINWTTGAEHDWTYTSQPSITPTSYYIAFWYEKYTYRYYTSTGNTGAYKGPWTYTGTFPDPITWTSTGSNNQIYIYATYTPGNGAAPPYIRRMFNFD